MKNMSLKKTSLTLLGGFIFVSVVMVVVGLLISYVSGVDPYTMGGYLGLAILIWAIFVIVIFILQIVSYRTDKGKGNHEKWGRK